MDSLYVGPDRSGTSSLPKAGDTDPNVLSQKTSNSSVKSKLRQLAEFRSRSKEFGSNDSLHLTPLHRSLSDPWLLKGTMEKGLDLSKSGSSSIMDLSRIEHTSGNSVDSSNSAKNTFQGFPDFGHASVSRIDPLVSGNSVQDAGIALPKTGKAKKKKVGTICLVM